MPRYEFKEGTSNKFWEITLDGTAFTTKYGKVGTDGQETVKEWDDDDKAKKEYDKLVAEKVKKGYKLVGGNGGGAAKAAPAAAKKKPVFEDEGDDDEGDDEEEEEAPKAKSSGGGGGGKKRHFEFVEGSSSKFWEIWMDGTSYLTRYGRIGTSGQETVKEWGTADKAKKEYDKIVAEKVKKGYVEK
jgi:predicted DNA-binding WGR domain protein